MKRSLQHGFLKAFEASPRRKLNRLNLFYETGVGLPVWLPPQLSVALYDLLPPQRTRERASGQHSILHSSPPNKREERGKDGLPAEAPLVGKRQRRRCKYIKEMLVAVDVASRGWMLE